MTDPRIPQTIVEVLRYNGMNEADIRTMIPGHTEPPVELVPVKPSSFFERWSRVISGMRRGNER